MITIEHLSKTFNDGNYVLKDISTSFQDSKINLIIGQSGSGKTVLMKCMLGLIAIEEGDIYYNDQSFSRANEKQKALLLRSMGMVFQGSALFDFMNVEENVMFPLKMFTNDPGDVIADKANQMLVRVGLSGANKKLPSEISGGMKKRVAIARAIILNPKYLFCDEPNSGLDPYTSSVIDNLIFDMTKEYKITTIINTHDMNTVLGMGERIVFIKKGKLEWEGKGSDIYDIENKNLEDFVFGSNSLKELRRLKRGS